MNKKEKVLGDTIRFKECPPEYKKSGIVRNIFRNCLLVIATEKKPVSPGVYRSTIVEFHQGHYMSFNGDFVLSTTPKF